MYIFTTYITRGFEKYKIRMRLAGDAIDGDERNDNTY